MSAWDDAIEKGNEMAATLDTIINDPESRFEAVTKARQYRARLKAIIEDMDLDDDEWRAEHPVEDSDSVGIMLRGAVESATFAIHGVRRVDYEPD